MQHVTAEGPSSDIKQTLSPTKLAMAENRYREIVSSCKRVVARFAFKHYPTVSDAMGVIHLSRNDFIRRHGNYRASSEGFHTYVLTPLKPSLESLFETEETAEMTASVAFPFLSEEGCSFAAEYNAVYGHYPIFHIIYDFIRHHSHRDVHMYRLKHGLSADGTKKDINSIASSFNLTRERARQITVKPAFLSQIDAFVRHEKHLGRYSMPGQPICFPTSLWFVGLTERERLQSSFVLFAEIYCNYFSFRHEHFHNLRYIVASDIQEDVKKVITGLEDYRKRSYTRQTAVPIDSFLNEFPSSVRLNVSPQTVALVLAPVLDITVDNNLNLVFEKNTLDIEDEVVSLLDYHGRPMRFCEIVAGIRHTNPSLTVKDSTIRFIIRQSERIVQLGKTSVYGLRDWPDIYIGNIRDSVKEILSESTQPIHTDEIVSRVMNRHPNTTPKSIISSISQSNHFVKFKPNHFGLKDKTYSPVFHIVPRRPRNDAEANLAALIDFVSAHRRLPCLLSSIEEIRLRRWIKNALNGRIDLSDGLKERLCEFLHEKRHLPQNQREYSFFCNCEKYRRFVVQHGRRPDCKNEAQLYHWHRHATACFSVLSDNCRSYLAQLSEICLSQ